MKCKNCNTEYESKTCPICNPYSESSTDDKNNKKINKVLGFRTNTIWKKVLSIIYLIFCGFYFLAVIFEEKYVNLPTGDFIIEKISKILIFLMMVSPYIFLSDTKIRCKLPMLKKKTLKTDIIVLLISIVTLGIFIGVTDTFHSEEFLADRENHDYLTTVTDATCEENGEERKICNFCGIEETNIIPSLGHTMIEISKKASTENAEGEIVEECSVCGIKNTIVLEKLTKKYDNRNEQKTENIQNNTSTTKATTQTTIAAEIKYELTDYVGKSIQYVSEKLGDHLSEMDTNNYYYQDSKTNLGFDMYTNKLGAITAIKLFTSGTQGYTLCGLSSETSVDESEKILTSKGFNKIKDNVWVSKSGKDVVMYVGDCFWVYEKDSPWASDDALKKATQESYEPRYNDSESTVYIGNGQLIELLNDSLTEFTYNFAKLTSYQRTESKKNIDGRYIRVHGTVTSVSSNGSIVVFCEDYNIQNNLFLEGTASASVTLLLQQNDLLMSINKGDEIIVYAKINADSYENLLGVPELDLYDGVLYSINNNKVAIPILDGNIDGIYRYIPTDYSFGHGGGGDL